MYISFPPSRDIEVTLAKWHLHFAKRDDFGFWNRVLIVSLAFYPSGAESGLFTRPVMKLLIQCRVSSRIEATRTRLYNRRGMKNRLPGNLTRVTAKLAVRQGSRYYLGIPRETTGTGVFFDLAREHTRRIESTMRLSISHFSRFIIANCGVIKSRSWVDVFHLREFNDIFTRCKSIFHPRVIRSSLFLPIPLHLYLYYVAKMTSPSAKCLRTQI